MKRIKFLMLGCVAVLLFACNTLDVPPMNIVKDSDLFNNQAGVTAYMANLYNRLPMVDRQDYGARGFAIAAYDALPENISAMANVSNDNFWWDYTPIRAACYFLQEFPAYQHLHDARFIEPWKGEVYFIQAYCYFRMVQCFGGVPIVNRVLDYPRETIDELKLSRNKEEECFDFILSNLDSAIAKLPPESVSDYGLSNGRVNKYVALAFKARVALYAGCVAKYGGETLAAWSGTEAVQKGLVGVPASRAQGYFQAAWEAAKAVESSGKYGLMKTNDKDENAIIQNYRKTFLEKSLTANKEMIFGRYYLYGYNATIIDANCLPYQLGGTYSMHVNPTMNFIKLFDDVDGNPIDWENLLGTDANYSNHLYADPADAFAQMEPRFKAVIAYPGSVFKNEVIEIRKGILKKDAFVEGGTFDMADVETRVNWDWYRPSSIDSIRIQGASGMGSENTTSTGFYCIKYLNESLPKEQVSSSNSRGETPYPEIRYAEVLLALAEAAVELGRPADAVPYVNAILERAGSKKRFTAGALTLEDVRKEWSKEFIWEAKSYWNLRRWRTFHSEIDNTALEILWPIYVWDKNAYYLRVLNTAMSNQKMFTFNPQFYYMVIPAAQIASNGNLIQNPGH